MARFLGFAKKPKKGENHYTEDFRFDSIPPASTDNESEEPERESVRVMVIGSRAGVIEQIHSFYQKGVAEVSAWSPLQRTGIPGKVMSILTIYRKRLPSG